MFMPVVPAILMRNEKHCSRFRVGLLIIVMIMLAKLRFWWFS